MLSTEPNMGLNPTTLGLWSELKSRDGCLTDWITQVPYCCIFNTNYSYPILGIGFYYRFLISAWTRENLLWLYIFWIHRWNIQYILEVSLYRILPTLKKLRIYNYLLEIMYLLEWKVISLILGFVLNKKAITIYTNILKFFKYLRKCTSSVKGNIRIYVEIIYDFKIIT